MLQKAITFPTEGDEAMKTILIGGVLSLLSSLIPIFLTFGFLALRNLVVSILLMILICIFTIPALIVYGYIVQVFRAGVNGDAEPPTFADWDSLAVDGLMVIAIGFGYFIIPAGLFFWGVFSSSMGATTTTGGMATSTGASSTMMIAFAVSSLLSLIASYLLPAAMASFAKEKEIAAAFSFGTIKDAALTSDYFIGWLMVLAVAIPYVVIYLVVMLIPFIGIFAVFLAFYFNIVVAYIMGRSFGKALDIEPETGGSGSAGAEVPA